MNKPNFLSNYHGHCHLDDGIGEIEEIVQFAIDKGFDALGFSCHTPNSLDDSWHMKSSDFDYYINELDKLKDKYKGQIELYKALELDYIETTGELAGYEYKKRLDYVIGAVHYIYHPLSGTYYTIDGPIDEFKLLLKDNYNNDIKKFVDHHFTLQEKMISNYEIDFIAHIDLIEKYNKHSIYYKPSEAWYLKRATSFLEKIKEKNVRVEINTGAMARGHTDTFYPSNELLKIIKEMEISLVVNSDSHAKENLDHSFDFVYKELKNLGFKEVDVLTNNSWSQIEL